MMGDEYGMAGKIVVFVFGLIAIVCSGKAANTCEFISFENTSGTPWQKLQPPFNTAIAANVGIFKYEILESSSGTETNGCVPYEERFLGMKDTYEALASAQLCALLAPIFGGLGVFLNLVWDESLVAGIFCLAAAGIQAGTFSMVADPSICFEDDTAECTTEQGTYLSATAFVFFFLCGSCLLCCMPLATRYRNKSEGSPPKSKKEQPPPSVPLAPPVQQVLPPVLIPAVVNGNESAGKTSRNASGKEQTKPAKSSKEVSGKKSPSSSGKSPPPAEGKPSSDSPAKKKPKESSRKKAPSSSGKSLPASGVKPSGDSPAKKKKPKELSGKKSPGSSGKSPPAPGGKPSGDSPETKEPNPSEKKRKAKKSGPPPAKP